MFGISFRLVVAIAACVASGANAQAADITPGVGDREEEVVIEGTIHTGDCDGLRNHIRASPDGNLLEAMLIGRLVRASKLKLQAVVPAKRGGELREEQAATSRGFIPGLQDWIHARSKAVLDDVRQWDTSHFSENDMAFHNRLVEILSDPNRREQFVLDDLQTDARNNMFDQKSPLGIRDAPGVQRAQSFC